MLETMGFEEEQIRKLWTISSILVARTLLFRGISLDVEYLHSSGQFCGAL